MTNLIQPTWPAPTWIKAYTTVRDAWGNFNIPADELLETYKEKTLRTLLPLPENLIWLTQTHSSMAVEAKPENIRSKADASFTMHSQQVCIVLTADCLPILISNKQGTCVAAIHAGWRGLANGIIEDTLAKLQQLPEELLVWLGPAIGPEQFEVGEDVFAAFTAVCADDAVAFVPKQAGKWRANLYQLARMRLQRAGIQHIYGGQYCTYSQPDLFFSYRRDKGHQGRMASLIWIDA